MSGFIAMSRDALNHPLLKDAERFRAWFWIVANACWKPTRVRIKGETIELQRGELSFSVRFLADNWGWSKSRVDRFLSDLRDEGMIETRSKIGTTAGHAAGQGQSIITVCNYVKYQDVDGPKRDNDSAHPGTTAGQQRDNSGTNKNKETREQDKGYIGEGSSITPRKGENEQDSPSFDLKKLTFDHVCAHLAANGISKSRAGSVTAGWRKKYSDGQILDALRRCMEASPAPPDPVTFIFQQLAYQTASRNPGHERSHENLPTEPSDPIARAAVKRQAARASAQRREQNRWPEDSGHLAPVDP